MGSPAVGWQSIEQNERRDAPGRQPTDDARVIRNETWAGAAIAADSYPARSA